VGGGLPHNKEEKSAQTSQTTSPQPIYGMMLRADASIHHWLEEKGSKLALIALIDDAANRVWETFREYEDVAGYLEVLKEVCLTGEYPWNTIPRSGMFFRISGS
jgi:hypothetical protein